MSNILKVKIGNEWVSIPALIGPIGPQGARGMGISSIDKTDSSGLVDTYTITYDLADADIELAKIVVNN